MMWVVYRLRFDGSYISGDRSLLLAFSVVRLDVSGCGSDRLFGRFAVIADGLFFYGELDGVKFIVDF